MFVKNIKCRECSRASGEVSWKGVLSVQKGCFRSLVKTTIFYESVVVCPQCRRRSSSSSSTISHPHRSTPSTRKQKKKTPLGFLRPLRFILVSSGSWVVPFPSYSYLYTTIYIYNYLQLPTTTYNYLQVKQKWNEGETKVKRKWNEGETRVRRKNRS